MLSNHEVPWSKVQPWCDAEMDDQQRSTAFCMLGAPYFPNSFNPHASHPASGRRVHISAQWHMMWGRGGWVHAYEICRNPEMRPGISKYGKPRKTNEDHHLSWGTISLQDLIPRVTRALQDCWMLNNWKQWWFCAWLRTIESVPMW